MRRTVLGTDYAGVLVRDGWAPYRCFRDAEHQSCLAHLLRRCKELQEDHPDSRWAGDVQATLQAGLDLRDRCNAGELSEHGMATARGRLIARLGRLVDAPPPLKDAVRFANHLVTEFLAVFLFLWDPSLDATNWRAEQAIRPAVVIRKVCGGNRTRRGADTQQVLSSVVRTARQRDLGLPPLIATILRATEPAVPAALIAGRAAAGAVEEMCATEPIGPEVLGLPPPPELPVGGHASKRPLRSAAGPAARRDAVLRGRLSDLRGGCPEWAGLGHHRTRRQAGASVRFPPRGIVLAVEAIRERNHRANATSSRL